MTGSQSSGLRILFSPSLMYGSSLSTVSLHVSV